MSDAYRIHPLRGSILHTSSLRCSPANWLRGKIPGDLAPRISLDRGRPGCRQMCFGIRSSHPFFLARLEPRSECPRVFRAGKRWDCRRRDSRRQLTIFGDILRSYPALLGRGSTFIQTMMPFLGLFGCGVPSGAGLEFGRRDDLAFLAHLLLRRDSWVWRSAMITEISSWVALMVYCPTFGCDAGRPERVICQPAGFESV